MPLGEQFASLFTHPRAKRALAALSTATHTRLPTFNLTTTSLRHLPKWFDRLQGIGNGNIPAGAHGNFLSDPAALGLVNTSVTPARLTPAGEAFLSFRKALRNRPQRAEYELLKILYVRPFDHSPRVREFLRAKADHLNLVVSQFRRTSTIELFVSIPALLAIAELIANFYDALPRLLAWPATDLQALANLGEKGFKGFAASTAFVPGLRRLCRRIAADYTRAEERRLHYLVGMALVRLVETVPPGGMTRLQVPEPFAQLLADTDIFTLHSEYTSDVAIWFDGEGFLVSTALAPPPVPPAAPALQRSPAVFQPQIGIPAGAGNAPADHATRRPRRAAKKGKLAIVIDPVLSERAEDFVETMVLRPEYGARVIRVGHRAGETIGLPDGMVPGSDFYIIGGPELPPTEFVEVKSISGTPPTEIGLTRAEYLRARRCAEQAIPYRLMLVDAAAGRIFEIGNFAEQMVTANLSEVVQFSIRVRAAP